MKKQTRLLSLLLVAVMIVSTLAGCASKPNVDAFPKVAVGTGSKSNNEVIVDENGNRYIDLSEYPELAEQLAAEEKKPDRREWNQSGEQIKDEEGSFIVPFDCAYPEVFENGEVEYDKEHALLKLDAEVSEVSRELRACGFAGVEKFLSTEKGDWYRATVAPTSEVVTAVNNARGLNCVLMADFDYITRTEAVEVEATENGLMDHVLDNEQVTDQWYLTQSEIQRAWRFLERNGSQAGGDSSVVVAVIDTGVDYNHPDLKANMWINMGEIPGNGIDDDGNGYIDDVYGCSTIGNTFVASGDPMDDHGHGTHVAGIIGASNNKEGIVGIAYNAKIMAIKAGQASGVFNQSDIAEAILYAYEMGADVINMSFGGSACSIAVQDALSTAYTRSTLVASAGNNRKPNEFSDSYKNPGDYLPNYPAALSYVIGVMSVNQQGVESGFTNWDAEAFNTVEYEVYAPGESMLSTLPGGRYGKLSGTSMSAPVVAASAALLRSYFKDRDMYPSKFIAAQLSATSEDAAICCDPNKHTVSGGPHNLPMILNTYDALTKLPKPDVSLYNYYLFDSESIADGNNGDGVIDAGETVNIGAVLRNRWGMSKDTIVTIDVLSSLGVANPYVEIINGTSNFEGVGTYSTKDQLIREENKIVVGTDEPLTVKIANNCPNDYRIVLNVTITYKNGFDEDDNTSYVNDKGQVEFWVRNGVVLPAVIRENTTLTKDNCYIVENSVYIPEGVTVTVEPGTQIQFWSDDPEDPYADTYIAFISVAGEFICQGTEEEMIKLFPSELMQEYAVNIRRDTNGYIGLEYTKFTNAYIQASKVDHCIFDRVYKSSYLQIKEISSGKVRNKIVNGGNLDCTSSIDNSIFLMVGGGLYDISYPFSYGNSGYYSYQTCKNCSFVDCNIDFSKTSCVNCLFLGNNCSKESDKIYNSTKTNWKTGVPSIHVGFLRNNPQTHKTYISLEYSFSGFDFDNCLEYVENVFGGYLACIETEEEFDFLKRYGFSGYVGLTNGSRTWKNGETVGDFIKIVDGKGEVASLFDNALYFLRTGTIILEIPFHSEGKYENVSITKVCRNPETGSTYILLDNTELNNDTYRKIQEYAESFGGSIACIESIDEEFFVRRKIGSCFFVNLKKGNTVWGNGTAIDDFWTYSTDFDRTDYALLGDSEHQLQFYCGESYGTLIEIPENEKFGSEQFYNISKYVGNYDSYNLEIEQVNEWFSQSIKAGKNNVEFEGNAILNNLNDTDVSHWLRITAENGYDSENTIGVAGNYWGTTDLRMIEKQIIDFDDNATLADIVIGEYLTVAPENTFPFVVDAYLLDRDGNRQFTVSNGTYTFVVEFNRDMDTTVPLRVRFGSSEPYAEYEISGEYVDARRWEGTYTLKSTIENGNQFFNIENGRAADDHFMALYDSPCRFMFEIDTTAAQALIMQGNATETGIELTWEQDDFDTLAGYNVYRSDREDGLYRRLNRVVIPADTKTFFDDTVEPGKVYYYNFTVVQSDMQESEPSGKIVIMSMDTMAPNIYHSPVRTAYTGNNLVVGATITDNLMIASATLYYRAVGTTEWKSTAMTANNSRYTAIIPVDALSLDGMEYYIDAFDGVSHTYKGDAENAFAVTVKLAVDRNSLGDVDGNGIIEMLDALMLLQAANDRLNLTEEQFLRADINGDGELSAAEALRILQYVSGKITTIQF